MLQSKLFQKTTKDISSDDVSRNAQFLTKAGYINRLMAGVYTFLPMGLKVMQKIENIVREEINAIGGQEVLMPALQPKEIWDTTGRWEMDGLYKLKGAGNRDFALGATHEEVVTPLAKSVISSYKDLPCSAYQIQTKFRNEARAKSGILRGREFKMKDLYSFHISQESLDEFYEKSIIAYNKIFARCGLGDITKLTYASGGAFSKYSHEFQTMTEYGEDTIYLVPGTDIGINKEIIDDKEALKEIVPNYIDGMEKDFETVKAIEIGNIFKLGTRFSDDFDLFVQDENGQKVNLSMGCYGIGISRLMGTIAECLSDDNGLIWPEEVAPYNYHIIAMAKTEEEEQKCEEVYNILKTKNIEVLYDDRYNVSAGIRFTESDLMGMPYRITLGKSFFESGKLELKNRKTGIIDLVDIAEL